jgi:tryptophanyl-tRNA synthetase
MTATAVNDFLEPLRVRRQAFAKDEDLVRAILRHGNEAANTSAESTLAQVREAMGTIY